MQKHWRHCQELFLFIVVTITTLPVWADLPQPPSKDIANSSSDWADVGSSIIFRVIGYSCYVLGALILMGVAGSILKAYQTAHEKQDLGHFFKMLVVGLVCAAMGIGLVYGGYTILPSQT